MNKDERAIKIGKRLREIRDIRPMTKVAKLAGVSYSELCKVEGGYRNPKQETLEKLLRYYGMTLDEFFLTLE